jgi:hypothetical protein
VTVVAGAVVVFMVSMALYWAHSASPMDSMAMTSVAEQEANRQLAAKPPMEFWVGPHWQAWSAGAQPALEMAEERQAEAHGGSPERFWAAERVRRVVRVRRWSFMVGVVVIGTMGFVL